MATTFYVEQDLPVADKNANAGAKTHRLGVYVSSFSGRHQLYVKYVDGNGEGSDLVLSKKQALELLEGLDRAMTYLQYDRD